MCVRSSRPLSKRITRFLPWDSTASTCAPTTRSIWGPGRVARAAVTARPTRYGRRPAAVRNRVSPSGMGGVWRLSTRTEHDASIARDEAGGDETLAEGRLADRDAVDLRDDQLPDPPIVNERVERG